MGCKINNLPQLKRLGLDLGIFTKTYFSEKNEIVVGYCQGLFKQNKE